MGKILGARMGSSGDLDQGLNGYINRIASLKAKDDEAAKIRGASKFFSKQKALSALSDSGKTFKYGLRIGDSKTLLGSFDMSFLDACRKNKAYEREFINSCPDSTRMKKMVLIGCPHQVTDALIALGMKGSRWDYKRLERQEQGE